MSSEDASVVMLRLPKGQGEPFPFPAQVEVPATAGKQAVLNAKVDEAIERWCRQQDWTLPARVDYSTEIDEDGVRRRVGRFTVTGYAETSSPAPAQNAPITVHYDRRSATA